MRGYELRDALGYDPNDGAFSSGGYLRTGDKGWLDAHGRLYLSGRFKEVINRAGEKISPLTVEHALLEAAPRGLPTLKGLLVFSAPHEELGEAVGAAVTVDPGARLTLKQLRAVGARAASLSSRWLPELLVIVDALPKGPTGKPKRIGLAEMLGVPMLSYQRSRLTIERRACATAAALDAESARDAAPPPPPTLDSDGRVPRRVSAYVALLIHGIHAVGGAALDPDEDLQEGAGLSSLTVARLRNALQAQLNVSFPPALLLQAPTARSLAASLLRHVRAASAGADGERSDCHEDDEDDASMILAEAEECRKCGRLEEANALCARAAEAMDVPLPPRSSPPLPRSCVPLLALLSAVSDRLKHSDMALAAYSALVGALGHGHADAAVVHAQIRLLHVRRGDESAALAAHEASVEAEIAAATRAEACSVALIAVGTAWGEYPPPALPYLPAARVLREVCLSGQGLETLPSLAFCPLIGVKRLDVSANRLVGLPGTVARMRSLRELQLSGNMLSALPDISVLPQLHVLLMQGNCFAALPPIVGKCTKLRSLKWGAQRVTIDPMDRVLDAGPGSVCSNMLATLELEVNGVEELPALNATNTVLTSLLASFNRLGDGPPERLGVIAPFGGSLKKLHLGCNNLPSVAGLLPALTRLVELTLEGNRLSSLPPCIGHLTKLKELWLHGNALEALPPELGDCKSLTVLQCHHNRLSELPDALAKLSKLQGLYLQSNRLSNLAELHRRILRHMPLQNLGLGNNELDLADAFEIDGARVGLGWNKGTPPPPLDKKLSMWFAVADHLFEPACVGVRGQILLVAFSAQGPGVQQWLAPVASARAAGMQLDALYVADPSNSYYLQDPTGSWEGVQHYHALVQNHARHYGRVLLIGSSMGASACLCHADLGHRAIAFAPRVDLSRSHGAYIPAMVRAAGLKRTIDALRSMDGKACVHVGKTNYVDVAQTAHVRHVADVHEWQTFHHNVPAFLEREGLLVPLLKEELLILLRER